MIIAALAVLITGVMLLFGGAMVALRAPQGKAAGIILSACGGVLVLLAVAALLSFLAPLVLS